MRLRSASRATPTGRLVDKQGTYVFAGQTVDSRGIARGISQRKARDFPTATRGSDVNGVAVYSFDTTFNSNDTEVAWVARLEPTARRSRAATCGSPVPSRN